MKKSRLRIENCNDKVLTWLKTRYTLSPNMNTVPEVSSSCGPSSAPAEVKISNISNGCEHAGAGSMPATHTPALSMARFADQQCEIGNLKMENDQLWMKLKKLEICHQAYDTKFHQESQNQIFQDEKEEQKCLANIEILREEILEEQKIIDPYVEKAMSLKYPTESTHNRFQELCITPRNLKKQKASLKLEKISYSNARVDQSWKKMEGDFRKLEDSVNFLESMCSMDFGIECCKNTLKLLDLPPLNLESWNGPTVYDACKSWIEFYQNNGAFSLPARKYFLEKCINSIVQKEVVTDIKQNIRPKSIEELTDYLLKTFGQPAKMQMILIQKHYELDKLV